MNKTQIITLISIVVLAISVCLVSYVNYNRGIPKATAVQMDVSKFDTKETAYASDWEVYKSFGDKDLIVSFKEKYGEVVVDTCKVIFINNKTGQFKLVGPAINVIIERSNLVYMDVK